MHICNSSLIQWSVSILQLMPLAFVALCSMLHMVVSSEAVLLSRLKPSSPLSQADVCVSFALVFPCTHMCLLLASLTCGLLPSNIQLLSLDIFLQDMYTFGFGHFGLPALFSVHCWLLFASNSGEASVMVIVCGHASFPTYGRHLCVAWLRSCCSSVAALWPLAWPRLTSVK